MPTPDTFQMGAVKAFIGRHLKPGMITADPFARNCLLATYTNDLNPDTRASYHLEAVDFMSEIPACDLIFFDPPYSPRQISECYVGVGKTATMTDTQSSFYSSIKDAIAWKVKPQGIVLSFCWNSNGMGEGRGFEILEIMNVAHDGWHNDTICMAERRKETLFDGV